MSSNRTVGTWDRIQNKLSAHWGKLTVDDLCLTQSPGETQTRIPLADSEPKALVPDRLALAGSGS